MRHLALALVVWGFCQTTALATPLADLKARRQDVFEFAERPSLSRQGDVVTITFASKGHCDVAVAIEDGAGRIVRHLAAGVLGPNAPEPFQKDSLRQTITWDCKDDLGEYVRNIESHAVRVSLGIKPAFERTMFWSPHKRVGRTTLLVRAAPEGVYVYDGGTHPQLRLFDRDGEYLRTIYPLSGERVATLDGIHRQPMPPEGQTFPLKWGIFQASFLTYDLEELTLKWPGGGSSTGDACGNPALDVHNGTVFLARKRLNRLPADERAANDLKLHGPPLTYPANIGGVHTFRGGTYQISPRSMAIAPDGRTAYLAGYLWRNSWREGTLNGVAKIDLFGDNQPKVVLGDLTQNKTGPAPQDFNAATSVDLDSKGRIYVTDYMNDRVQVFTPDGKLVRSISITRPALVRINRKTDEIYVFTWTIASSYDGTYDYRGKPTLTWLGPVEDPKVKAAWQFDGVGGWSAASADIDFHAEQLTVWLSTATLDHAYWNQPHVRLLIADGDKLVTKLDFRIPAKAAAVQIRPPHHSRQRLFVNPVTGALHVGEHHQPSPEASKSFQDLVTIDPNSGRIRMLPIPFDAEDLAFDILGNAYLRTENMICRYSTTTEPWREMPFDYGEERQTVFYNTSVGKKTKVVSGIPFVGQKGTMSHLGGLAVSPRGHVAVVAWNQEQAEQRKDAKNVFSSSGGRTYTPRIYPGRARSQEIHVFDRHGKLLYEDALPGVGLCSGLAMDARDNLYVLMAGTPMIDGQRWPNPIAATLIRFAPGKCRILSSGAVVPMEKRPDRPADIAGEVHLGAAWVEGADWRFPGAGYEGKLNKCSCASNSRVALDYFARSFVPEIDRYRVAVLDSNGNVILRLGRYGNVDEGSPLVPASGPAQTRALAGDQVTLMHPQFLAVHTDRRLFIADPGNARIVSVRLDYYAEERVSMSAAGGHN